MCSRCLLPPTPPCHPATLPPAARRPPPVQCCSVHRADAPGRCVGRRVATGHARATYAGLLRPLSLESALPTPRPRRQVRQQAATARAPGPGQPVRLGQLQLLSRIAGAEGAAALYRGVWPPLITKGVETAVVFAAYSWFLRNVFGCAPALGGVPGNGAQSGQPSLAQVGAAGSFAGAISVLINTPAELVKVKQQVATSRVAGPGSGVVATVGRIVRADGPMGLLRGGWACFLRDMPSFAIYFGVYELVMRWCADRRAGPGPGGGASAVASSPPQGGALGAAEVAQCLVAGALAGGVSWTAVYPFDTVKTVIQAEPGAAAADLGPIAQLRRAAGRGSHTRLWHGYRSCMCRALPLNAFTFLGYELAMRQLDALERRRFPEHYI